MLSRTGTVVRSATVPIFRNYVGGEGMGVLGGIHMDVEEQCVKVGEMVKEVLAKGSSPEISLVDYTESRTSFDYSLMKDFNLDFSLLPKDTIFYNKPESFISHYGKIFPPIIMLFITLVVLMFYSKCGKMISMTYIAELKKSQKVLLAIVFLGIIKASDRYSSLITAFASIKFWYACSNFLSTSFLNT